MELILGGYAQGQLDFAKFCYPDAVVFDADNLENLFAESFGENGDKNIKIWDNFNISMKKMIESGKNDDEIRDMIQKSITFHKNLVVISDEIGCGIIPMDARERYFREFIGRIQCFLAEKADKVVRVVCGIPQRIK